MATKPYDLLLMVSIWFIGGFYAGSPALISISFAVGFLFAAICRANAREAERDLETCQG